MTKLSKAAFLSKYATIFEDNTNREISEEDIRDFRQDINDSFLNITNDFYSGVGGWNHGINTLAELKTIATISMVLKSYITFRDTDNADILRVYELVSGTDAESSPNVLRPNDFDSTTNPKVWKKTKDEAAVQQWSFPAGALPTQSNVLYIATADYGTLGDPAGYIPTAAWFIATSTPSTFSDFFIKL